MPEPDYSPQLNAHIWRNWRNVSGRLACGILLDGRGGVEKWARQVIELLTREPAVAIESIYRLPDSEARTRGSSLFGWLERWSRLTYSPLERVDAPGGIPIVSLEAGQFPARIAQAGLDVLIWLESHPPDWECDGLARAGVLYFSCGPPDQPRSNPPYWREIASGSPVSALALMQDSGRGDCRCLALCQVPTRQELRVTANAVSPLTLAGPVLLRHLLNFLDPDRGPALSPPVQVNHGVLAPPGNRETIAWLVRQAYRAVSVRAGLLHRDAHWFVAVKTNRELFRACQDHFVAEGFRDIPAIAGSQFADPFVVADRGRNWLFVEEIPRGTSKGRLAVLELTANGGFGKPMPILERPYNLSYPHVFGHGDEFFMLPETAANNTIELYRATRFPYEWALERVLAAGVCAVDTTPVLLDGIWYFFTTSARQGYETFLFWSPALDGEWRYHRCNPICSDVRRARGAGPLFRSHDALIRPAQDCSVRYGYALSLNRVRTISPDDYEEELIEVILPTWRAGLLGTHTLSSNDAFEAVDGLRRRP